MVLNINVQDVDILQQATLRKYIRTPVESVELLGVSEVYVDDTYSNKCG